MVSSHLLLGTLVGLCAGASLPVKNAPPGLGRRHANEVQLPFLQEHSISKAQEEDIYKFDDHSNLIFASLRAHLSSWDSTFGPIYRRGLSCITLADKWAKQYELDGFVREEGTFEYIHCDFSSSALHLVRSVDINVVASNGTEGIFPGPPPPPGRPANGLAELMGLERSGVFREQPPKRPGDHKGGGGGWRGASIYGEQTTWLFRRATSWHHIRPDPRLHTYPEYMVTLFDPSYTSLASTLRLPRGDHSLLNLSKSDTESFMEELHDAIHQWNSGATTSGVDWAGIASAVVDRYSGHLTELYYLLQGRSSVENITLVVDQCRLVTFGMLLPYTSGPEALSVFPSPPSRESRRRSMLSTRKMCTDGFTGHLRTNHMTRQELRLKAATEGVLHKICAVASEILVKALTTIDGGLGQAANDPVKMSNLLAAWDADVASLMRWLDWPSSKRCDKQCARDEVCFIPAPMMNPRPGVEPRCVGREDDRGRDW
ncbi:hypothetical protein P7C70_g1443, partial [Phenoliferia sp. Uapishka_3]